MAGKFLFALVAVAALCVLRPALAGKARAKEDEAVQPAQFEELSKKATDFVGELGTQFDRVVGAKDGRELQAILRNNTDSFIANIFDLTKSLQAQMSTVSGDVSGVVGQAIAKLNQTVIDLQQQNPEITKKAKEFQDKLQESFKAVVAETDKVAKSLGENAGGVQEDVAKLTKKAYDQVVQTAQTIQKQVHEAANKA